VRKPFKSISLQIKVSPFFTKAIGCYDGGQGDEHVPITKQGDERMKFH
jgi:hypothetical protein